MKEIGLRIALGAQLGQLTRSVVGGGLRLVAIGIGSGLRRNGLPALQETLLSAAQTLSNQLCGER